jgi:hypothetical protein
MGNGFVIRDTESSPRCAGKCVESLKIDWYGWHGFRRGIASNLYELGADEKIIQIDLVNQSAPKVHQI